MTTPRRYPSIADPMPGRPALETAWTEGPGPLSPVWPKPPVVEPPRNEWDGMSRAFSALRLACWASLRQGTGSAPFMLSFDESQDLEAKFLRIKAGNAELPEPWRMADVAAWPEPFLPRHVLFGARDLAAFLEEPIHAANKLSRYADWLVRSAEWDL